jgi:hypothetical protein
MLYRIFTENKNLKTVEKLVSKYFDGFTILKSTGYWRLQREHGLVIEVTDPTIKKTTIDKLAREIRDVNAQETVLVQRIKNNMYFI